MAAAPRARPQGNSAGTQNPAYRLPGTLRAAMAQNFTLTVIRALIGAPVEMLLLLCASEK